ncbi:MAG: beta-ketoacyl synthase [Pseudomonadales bacterium]|nr:beta-ketoacyl synthase [Pseudomonadales bacterium]
MSHLPVIVGMGGINSGGRSSSHHNYRRLVIDRLSTADADATLSNLAVLMGLLRYKASGWQDAQGNAVELKSFLASQRQRILEGTLIRKLETGLFDYEALRCHINTCLNPDEDAPFSFIMPARDLPAHIPANWVVTDVTGNGRLARIKVAGPFHVLLEDQRRSEVQCAGQLPRGFDPQAIYPSRNHPRGLQMTVFGASDALDSLGLDWELIRHTVRPDQISVYAGSSMSQLDYNGNGGMLQARLLGKRVTSKQLPLGFAEMPADFINAYLLGNVGATGTSLGACATFHYNLNQAIQDIRSGSSRVVIVGGSEAPLLPEIIEGYTTMGALADDIKLLALDAHKQLTIPDYRRACRPFGENAGFTLGESAQFVVLFDDELALELGANILGAVNDVFINADGYKKSISSPGIGNYITMAKATAATRSVIGEQRLRHHTFVQAHGTGTPQNRVTESAIFSRVAQQFGIENWPVTAVKAYLGHSLCASGADQLAASLGIWKYGIIPGITTTEAIADDVCQAHLAFLLAHRDVHCEDIDAILLNAKGFGGNNATASILAPHVTTRMLSHKHGQQALKNYLAINEKVQQAAQDYDERSCRELVAPTYRFDHDVRHDDDLEFSATALKIRGYGSAIDLNLTSNYPDMDARG